jgi:hypothetical protein
MAEEGTCRYEFKRVQKYYTFGNFNQLIIFVDIM